MWLIESEPFLTLARQLQEMKLALEDALLWIETINEVAQIQNMDNKSAGVLVAQELTLKTIWWQRQIETAQRQLKMLNTISAQKEKALSVLAELQNKGVSSDTIYGFSKILDLEWAENESSRTKL
jgi:hypothetical protein